MLRTTTLLLVMALASGPAGALTCEVWCSTAAAESHHAAGCHDASRGWPMHQQVASTAGCHDAAVLSLFPGEARLIESQRMAAPLALFQFEWVAAGTSAIAGAWCGLDVAPPRPSSSGSVLRV